MNLKKKLAEIRQQPEQLRLRYVWGAVAGCMVLIFGLWLISLKQAFRASNSEKSSQAAEVVKKELGNLKEQTSSIEELRQKKNPQADSQLVDEGLGGVSQ